MIENNPSSTPERAPSTLEQRILALLGQNAEETAEARHMVAQSRLTSDVLENIGSTLSDYRVSLGSIPVRHTVGLGEEPAQNSEKNQ